MRELDGFTGKDAPNGKPFDTLAGIGWKREGEPVDREGVADSQEEALARHERFLGAYLARQRAGRVLCWRMRPTVIEMSDGGYVAMSRLRVVDEKELPRDA